MAHGCALGTASPLAFHVRGRDAAGTRRRAQRLSPQETAVIAKGGGGSPNIPPGGGMTGNGGMPGDGGGNGGMKGAAGAECGGRGGRAGPRSGPHQFPQSPIGARRTSSAVLPRISPFSPACQPGAAPAPRRSRAFRPSAKSSSVGEDGVSVGRACGRLADLGQRQRRTQAEAARALRLRDGDRGPEGLLGGAGWIRNCASSDPIWTLDKAGAMAFYGQAATAAFRDAPEGHRWTATTWRART